MKKLSAKTTVSGLAGIIATLALVIQAQFDGDPITVPDWNMAIIAITTGLGLIFARDNSVTSEKAGAK
jgi:hypothetical protein